MFNCNCYKYKIKYIVFSLLILFNNYQAADFSNKLFVKDSIFSKYVLWGLKYASYVEQYTPDINKVVSSFVSNKIDLYNGLYWYYFVLPYYVEFTEKASGQIDIVFSQDQSIIDEINEKRMIKKPKPKSFLSFFFQPYILHLFNLIYVIKRVFAFSVYVINFLLSIQLQTAVRKDKLKTFYDESSYFLIFVKAFNPKINEETFLEALNAIDNTEIANINLLKNTPIFKFIFCNSLVNKVSMLVNFALSKVGLKFPYDKNSGLFDLDNILSETFNTEMIGYDRVLKNHGLYKINYGDYVSTYYHLYQEYLKFTQAKLLLKFTLDNMEKEGKILMTDKPIVFDQKIFPKNSLRSFVLDNSKNKKQIFILLRKSKKLIKKYNINFKECPSVAFIFLSEIGYGKTSMLNIFVNFLEEQMAMQKVAFMKAVFFGRIPALKNLSKKDELKPLIPKSFEKALTKEVNLTIIENINEVLPNRTSNLSVDAYLSINKFLTSVNVGENNSEKANSYSGFIAGTAQNVKQLDAAVLRRCTFIDLKLKNSNRLKKFFLINQLLKSYRDPKTNKYFRISDFRILIIDIISISKNYEPYRIPFLLDSLINYMKFFCDNTIKLKKKYEKKCQKSYLELYKNLAKLNENIDPIELENNDLYAYGLKNLYRLNKELMIEFIKLIN